MSSGPWKKASSSSPSVSDNKAGGRAKNDPTSSFPPLSAHTQTKTQRRTRALYSQTPHFNPYPPRQEQLNRQELDRLQLDSEGGETAPSAGYEDEESQRQDERSTGERSLGSGMSSITLLNKDGERFVRGPEYCYRRKTASSSLRKGDDKSATGSSTATSERQKAPFTKRRRRGAEERQVDLPTPFTDAKIDALVTECKRRQRALAAEQRQAPERTDAQQQDSCKPFTDELEKAFSSLDGFLAAFSKDSVGEGEEEEAR